MAPKRQETGPVIYFERPYSLIELKELIFVEKEQLSLAGVSDPEQWDQAGYSEEDSPRAGSLT